MPNSANALQNMPFPQAGTCRPKTMTATGSIAFPFRS
jgi:hypothetical protein